MWFRIDLFSMRQSRRGISMWLPPARKLNSISTRIEKHALRKFQSGKNQCGGSAGKVNSMSMRIDFLQCVNHWFSWFPCIYMNLHRFPMFCLAVHWKNALRKINADSIPIQFQFNVVARLGKVNSMSMHIDILSMRRPIDFFHIDFLPTLILPMRRLGRKS